MDNLKNKDTTLSKETTKELLALASGFDDLKISVSSDDKNVSIVFHKLIDDNAGVVFHSDVDIDQDGEIAGDSHFVHSELLRSLEAFNRSEVQIEYSNRRAELDQ